VGCSATEHHHLFYSILATTLTARFFWPTSESTFFKNQVYSHLICSMGLHEPDRMRPLVVFCESRMNVCNIVETCTIRTIYLV
jgi:hypothetical protein